MGYLLIFFKLHFLRVTFLIFVPLLALILTSNQTMRISTNFHQKIPSFHDKICIKILTRFMFKNLIWHLHQFNFSIACLPPCLDITCNCGKFCLIVGFHNLMPFIHAYKRKNFFMRILSPLHEFSIVFHNNHASFVVLKAFS